MRRHKYIDPRRRQAKDALQARSLQVARKQHGVTRMVNEQHQASRILIPCRNESQYIRGFLDSLLAQDLEPEWEIEVLVADGMSDDGTREVLCQYAAETPQVRIIDNPGRIVSTGLNAAIREAAGDIIIRMDAHTIYARDYVCECVQALAKSGMPVNGKRVVVAGSGPLLLTVAKYLRDHGANVRLIAEQVQRARQEQRGTVQIDRAELRRFAQDFPLFLKRPASLAHFGQFFVEDGEPWMILNGTWTSPGAAFSRFSHPFAAATRVDRDSAQHGHLRPEGRRHGRLILSRDVD